MMYRLRWKKSDFTLTELLVVIAVIAILAGLLLPALKSATDKSRSISCVSNLKQQYTMVIQYTADWNDRMPTHNKYPHLLAPYASIKCQNGTNDNCFINWKKTRRPFAPFDCPAGPTLVSSSYASGDEPGFTGYSGKLNRWYAANLFAWGIDLDFSAWKFNPRAFLIQKIYSPSTRSLIMDTEAKKTLAISDCSTVLVYNTNVNYMTPRHLDGINVLYAAGNIHFVGMRIVPERYGKAPNPNFWHYKSNGCSD